MEAANLPTKFPESETKPFTVIVTGANSGLGFAICTRLIEQNLKSPSHSNLRLIPTVRSKSKADSTTARLEAHARQFRAELDKRACAEDGVCPISTDPVSSGRITITPGQVNLSSLPSVKAFVDVELARLKVSHVDVAIMNAGIGGWSGVDWLTCFYEMLFVNWISAVTYPTYKLAHVGLTAPRQIERRPGGDGKGEDSDPEPHLGGVFCANVFGHYLLGHYLSSLLRRAFPGYGRVLWISSLEAYSSTLDTADLQGLRSKAPYESSKRLTDVLALSSGLPSTAAYVKEYFQEEDSQSNSSDSGSGAGSTATATPGMYLCHPGICGTSIFPLMFPLPWLMLFGFWIARLLGGPWQTLSPYKAATAPVWLATVDPESLAESEQCGEVKSVLARNKNNKGRGYGRVVVGNAQRCKWGSASTRLGTELILPTEVEGWAVRGVPNERPALLVGIRPDLKEPQSKADRDRFDDEAVACWRQMEDLRREWEDRLANAAAMPSS